jgi:hypothetical protein
MKFLVEFLPLILFFIAFKWQGIYVATGVAIRRSVMQFAWFKLRGKPFSTMQWLEPRHHRGVRGRDPAPAGRPFHPDQARPCSTGRAPAAFADRPRVLRERTGCRN